MDPASTAGELGTELVEQISDFFRASALYPPNNARVQRTAATAIETADAIRGERPHVKVRVAHDGFTVNNQPVRSEKANVEWLAETMRETALGGIDLSPELTVDALLEFAKRLRENAGPTQQTRTFAGMWSEAFAGITPVERLFILSSTEWNQLPEELRGILDEDSPRGARLREMLEASAPVIEQVTELVDDPDHEHGEMMVGGAVDLLRRILDALPPDLLEDPAGCMQIVQRILDSGAQSLAELKDEGDATGLRRMVIEVSSRYFSRPDGRSEEDIAEPKAKPSGPQGHAGDEKISDDVEAFVREFEALPDGPDLTIDAHSVDSSRERLGLCLHLLLRVRYAEEADRLEGPLAQLLDEVDDLDVDMLRVYLDALRSTDEELPWLNGLLERTGLLRHAIDCGLMRPQAMVSMFPTAFGPYLDALHDDADGIEALTSFLELLETDGVLSVRDQLVGADGILTPERFEKLLATVSLNALPFVWLAVSSGMVRDLEPVIDYLQRLKLTNPESAALRVLEPGRIPMRYVAALCAHEIGQGDETSALARESEALIRAFIDDCDENVDVKRQVRAIGALDAFWSTRVEEYVSNLARGAGLLRLRKRPRQIRDAARALLSTRRRK